MSKTSKPTPTDEPKKTVRWGLKQLPFMLGKMDDNMAKITACSSMLSTERPPYGTEKEATKKLNGLIQSNLDLKNEYLTLLRRIQFTNMMTTVMVMGETYTLSDIVAMKRTILDKIRRTWASVNTTVAIQKHRAFGNDKEIKIIPLYDEERKDQEQARWLEWLKEANDALEITNASTKLLEFPKQ